MSATGNSVTLSGQVRDASVAARAVEIAKGSGAVVIDNLSIPTATQVMLKVRFAEVTKSALEEWSSTLTTVNPQNLSDNGDIFARTNSDGNVTFNLSSPGSSLSAAIRWLKGRGDFKDLAEPNLLALPGKEASFLAGGESPYPTVQSAGTGGLTNAVTGLTDGRLSRCLQNGTCPKIFEVNSENEYWAKAGSLLHTDTRGQDLADPPNVRHYLLASLPHGPGGGSGSRGICQQPLNPLTGNASLRALLVNLDDWVTQSKEPPDSRVPRVANGTLVPPLPQPGVGFPSIPGVVYNGRLHEGDLFDFGASFGMGVLSVVPPRRVGAPYPALVPKTDVDGNDLAGVRTVDVEVPVATPAPAWRRPRARVAAPQGVSGVVNS